MEFFSDKIPDAAWLIASALLLVALSKWTTQTLIVDRTYPVLAIGTPELNKCTLAGSETVI